MQMTALWLTLIGLLFTAVLIIFLPLFVGRKSLVTTGDSQQQNVTIFKDRLRELEYEKNQGNLDETTFLQLKSELEKSLLADVEHINTTIFTPVIVSSQHWLGVATLAFFVILISLAMYVDLGRSEDFGQYLTLQAKAAEEAKVAEKSRQKLVQLMGLLREKLKQNPQDAEKWFLLASSYAATGQYPQAAQTYQDALKNVPQTDTKYASLKGSYARMLFQMANEQVTPAVIQAVNETLAIDPQESSALILSGIQKYTQGDIPQAIVFWEKAKIKADENTLTGFIEPVIAQAQAQLTQMPPKSVTAQTGTAKIVVKIDVDTTLKNKVNPEQVVFVFARPVGGRMPLAAEKLQVKDLPKTIVLDDSKSPMPTAALSSVAEVDITARISLSGQPMPSTGDFFATAEKVKVSNNEKVIELLINQEMK
jgi:cytochrome c-type biogenesis protein CcmH